MPELQQYQKITGAFKRPMWREVLNTNILHKKAVRTTNVVNIVVSVKLESGETKNFQGDEISQTRLTRWIILADKKELIDIPWKTYENEDVLITTNDAVEILYQAGLAQTELWFTM